MKYYVNFCKVKHYAVERNLSLKILLFIRDSCPFLSLNLIFQLRYFKFQLDIILSSFSSFLVINVTKITDPK